MTQAGDLNQRIYIQYRDPSLNSMREQSKSWLMLTPNGIWAQKRFVRARDFDAAAAQQSENVVKFRVRYRTDVTEKMRVLWRGEPYDIVGFPDDEKGGMEWLDILCAHGVRDGRTPGVA